MAVSDAAGKIAFSGFPESNGAWPSMCWSWNAASFSRHSGSLFRTPDTFINSARPMTFGWSRYGVKSSTVRWAPDVSRFVAGTQEDSCMRRFIAVAISRKYFSPSGPRTLQISCGSQIAVVVPRGRTLAEMRRSNVFSGANLADHSRSIFHMNQHAPVQKFHTLYLLEVNNGRPVYAHKLS